MDEMNVKVAVRVRPLLQKEKLASETNCVRVISSTNQLVLGKDRAFTFDHVLASKTTQDDAYDKCVTPLVKSCFEGYNCTVFAYGQTGSGKTFTMGGGNIASQSEDEFGIIPRAIADIFEMIQETKDKLLTIKVSYIEIYKEELRDLLDLETSSKDMHVREDEEGNTVVIGVTEVECESLEEVMALLEQGSSYRHTASTQMNDVSSRSHSIFTLLLEQKWADGEVEGGLTERKKSVRTDDDEEMSLTDVEHYIGSKFHFVDLAGSERAHRTGNIGDRFKESVHINSGLLALGNVISALGDPKRKATHVPYRESKITRLLKDSLGGNAQTLMICCISPSSSNFDESLNALKYANRAKNIRNKPIINRDPHSIRFEEMQSEIKALREELQKQRVSLMTATTAGGGDYDMKRVIEDQGVIKQLEDKVVKLQTECDHYRMVAEEAYRHLMDIQDRDILSQSLNVRLRDWLELMEEIKNKVPATLNKDAWQNHTITRLEEELKKCKSDLKSDEEIFAEKVKEVAHLAEQNSKLVAMTEELTKQCEEYETRMKTQDEQLVVREVKLQELQAKVKELESVSLSGDFDMPNVSGPPTTNRRAKSVPAHMLGNRSARLAPDSARNIHTSPAVFSLERVMQGFRARSQLLNSRLEDSDDVQQQLFSDDEEEDEDEADGEEVFRHSHQSEQGKFERNTQDRSTYKVRQPKSRVLPDAGDKLADILRASQTDDEKLSRRHGGVQFGGTFTKRSRPTREIESHNTSAELQKKKLKRHEIEMRQSTQKMRDLSINIKMKEQLIKELVKSSRDAHGMNEQYKEKIAAMEKEKQSAKQELGELQRALQDVEQREQADRSEKSRLESEFRKKMDTAKIKITTLQKKQKDTERLASITGHNDKRIGDLEGAVEKMRNQQSDLQKRLKEETDRKAKLERDMEKEHKRIKELELKNEQQKKVLKVKTEEMTALQKRLRAGHQMPPNRLGVSMTRESQIRREEQGRLEEQKKYLDQEMEKVLEQRVKMDQLEKELHQREDIVAKKEAMLAEKSELEIKKLRSSQVLNKDMVSVAAKLQTVEHRIEEKASELDSATTREDKARIREELHKLSQGREKLRKQRGVLDNKLQDGILLSPQEERRLIELDEAIEALDAAIDYKNEAIKSARDDLRKSTALSQSNNLLSRLSTLSVGETRTLLTKYFEKVIDLREDERKKSLECSTLEMKMEEQERLIQDFEQTLQRQAIEMDRKITQQQQQYEKKIQVLMQQLMESAATAGSRPSSTHASGDEKAKIQQLEKDLYYYKKTSRDLKKKLRELAGHLQGQNGPDALGDGLDLASSQESVYSNPGRVNGSHQPAPPSRQKDTPREAGIHPGGEWDRLPHVRGDSSTPVRISRKDLRRISDQEVKLRKSQQHDPDSTLPTDSLEVGGVKNPWT